MDDREREFVDRMGLLMERLGGPRTMGRLYGWLMICDPPHQSITGLAAALEVSKASISTTARLLQQAEMIERVPSGNREHRYRITPGGWAQVLRAQTSGVRLGLETIELGLSAVGEDRAEQRARLEETHAFFAFVASDAEALIQRWEDYRRSGS
ncbi:GbsR/MarR family transcriptional regulator [Nonomuraea sp. NPDC050556]|uniref:GbsR/MarR family transcriptional regulator n=1 Tax=Nonomuraea sp. NPDC050556 TaxID=3364369 RepID=UPI0037981E10